MARYWQRVTSSASGSGDMTYEPGTSTVAIQQFPPLLTGTDALLRLIITGKLTVVPDATSPLLTAGWPGRCEARLVAALQVPTAAWPNYVDDANVNILGRTVMNVTPLAANSTSLNGAAVWQTTGDINLGGMRDFSKYTTTPVLRLGGNWASEDLGNLTGNTFDYVWFGTVSVLWETTG